VLDYLDRAGERYGVDPRGLAVGGDSAGGNLAAVAALIARDRGGRRPVAQVLIYPMLDATCGLPSHAKYGSGYGAGSDDMRRGYREYLPRDVDPRDSRVSPLWAPDLSGLPPALVLTAEFDCLADEGERYAERLREAGVPVIHRRYPGVVHGFLQMAGIWDTARDALSETARLIASLLAPRVE
jgi:acetyl esterase